jgi:hypothetical protein
MADRTPAARAGRTPGDENPHLGSGMRAMPGSSVLTLLIVVRFYGLQAIRRYNHEGPQAARE